MKKAGVSIEEEHNFVFDNYESMKNKDIALKLGRPQQYINSLIGSLTTRELLQKTGLLPKAYSSRFIIDQEPMCIYKEEITEGQMLSSTVFDYTYDQLSPAEKEIYDKLEQTQVA